MIEFTIEPADHTLTDAQELRWRYRAIAQDADTGQVLARAEDIRRTKLVQWMKAIRKNPPTLDKRGTPSREDGQSA